MFRKRKRFKKFLQYLRDKWFFEVDLMLDDFKKLQEKVGGLETELDIRENRSYRLEDTVATHCQTIPHLSKYLEKKVKALEEWRDSHTSWDAQSWTKFNKRIEDLEFTFTVLVDYMLLTLETGTKETLEEGLKKIRKRIEKKNRKKINRKEAIEIILKNWKKFSTASGVFDFRSRSNEELIKFATLLIDNELKKDK